MMRVALLALLVAGVLQRPAAAAEPEQFRFALVGSSGLARVIGESDLRPEQLAELRHAWVWSAGRVAVRVETAELKSGAWRDRIRVSRDSSRFTIRTLESSAGADAKSVGSAIVAPLEMWTTVAESELPAYPVKDGVVTVQVPSGTPLRVRLTGGVSSSRWIESRSPATVTVPVFASTSVTARVVDEDGAPVPVATLAVIPEGENRAVAQWVTDARGVLRVVAPRNTRASLIVTAAGFVPAAITGTVEDFPAQVRLRRGRSITARILSPDAKPVRGATACLEAWIEGTNALFTRAAETGEDGRWSIDAAPQEDAQLVVTATGFAPRTVAVPAAARDLGDLLLTRAASATLVVRSATDDAPVPRATATPLDGAGNESVTDEGGRVVLEQLAAGGETRVRFRARGFIESVESILPGEKAQIVELTPAVTVRGRFIDEAKQGILASISVRSGQRFTSESTADDGTFELFLEPGLAYDLLFESAAADDASVGISERTAGEIVDLGDVVAERGITVTGLVHDEAQQPLSGARIWTPRSGPGGPLVAWVNGRLRSATTAADGRFELRGMPAVRSLLRIERPGKARAYVTVDPGRERTIDVGTIVLEEGATLRVKTGPGTDLTVVLDPRGRWEESDWLSAPAREGVATLRHVPRGPAVLQVRSGSSVLCHQTVEVEESASIDADCASRRVEVSGRVTFGAVAATEGELVWTARGGVQPESGIFTTSTAAGSRQQQVYGAGPPRVAVPLASDGSYRTHDVSAGEWTVVWRSATGTTSEPRPVDIPDAKTFTYVLDLGGAVVRGRVLDGGGAPVARALVRSAEAKASA